MTTVTDPEVLRSHCGDVPKRAAGKVHARLDQHDRAFVAASPFLVLASLDEVLADQVPDLTLPGSVRLGSKDDPLW